MEILTYSLRIYQQAIVDDPNGHARNLTKLLVSQLRELDDVFKILAGSKDSVAKLYIFTHGKPTRETEEAVSAIYNQVIRTDETRKLVEIAQVVEQNFDETELKDKPDFVIPLFHAPTDRGMPIFPTVFQG